jgi:nitrate reductase NapE component
VAAGQARKVTHPERGIPGARNHRTLIAVILFVVAPALSVAAAKVGFYGFSSGG